MYVAECLLQQSCCMRIGYVCTVQVKPISNHANAQYFLEVHETLNVWNFVCTKML